MYEKDKLFKENYICWLHALEKLKQYNKAIKIKKLQICNTMKADLEFFNFTDFSNEFRNIKEHI